MFFLILSSQVFLPLPFTPATSIFLQASPNHLHSYLRSICPSAKPSPHQPHSEYPEDCTNPQCTFYSSTILHTSISPSIARSLLQDFADSFVVHAHCRAWIRMNLQKADGNRFDYFVFFYPRAVYCDRPTQLYLKGRGGAKNWGTLSRGFGLRSFRPEISAWGVFVYIFYRSSFPKFPEVVSRGFPK